MAHPPTLESFDISTKTGFVPEKPPLTTLPPYFKRWNEVVSRLSTLLQNHELRNAVHELPALEFSEATLSSDEEWRAALVLLSGLFQGYMWQDGEDGLPSKMPSILTIPFHSVTQKVGTPLVGTYASTVLYNWHLRDSEKEMTIDNLQSIVNHTGSEDESWFFMIHVLIELEAVPAVVAIWNSLAAQREGNNAELVKNLSNIKSALEKMGHALGRMSERCSPKAFYVNIRPFVAGTKGLKAFPNGMIYDGVYSEPQAFSGGSAAQSTPLKAIDIYLGVEHSGEESAQFLDDMRTYMPSKHSQFLQYLSDQPSLRRYVLDSHDEKLIMQFNATIEALVKFRSDHIVIVTRFIVNQIEHTVNNKSLKDTGTGGTSFMKFLKEVREDTAAAKIPV